MLFNTKSSLEKAMEQAKNYEQWKTTAIDYDEKTKLSRWKQTDITPLYDYISIRNRLDQLRLMRANHDNHGLLFTLNEGIHGNMGGMGKEALYKKARFGTKQLIVQYHEEVAAALEHLADPKVADISIEEKFDFFHRASHCFGRSALMLSGAGTLLYFHLGVVKALWEQGLMPSIISGSSGGAVVAALVGTHSHADLKEIFDVQYLRLEAEKSFGFFKSLYSFKNIQMAVEDVRSHIERLVPDITFQEAYERTGIHINISVAPAETHQTSRLLNATTSPNVLIREAVLASCAAPGFYPPVALAAKNAKGEKQPYLPARKWVDGSLSDDLPIKRLSRLYGVNHCIVSQTNPLVLPFLGDGKDQHSLFGIARHSVLKLAKEWSLVGTRVIQKPLRSRPILNRMLKTYTSVVSQIYMGDINILPPKRIYNPLNVLAPRTKDEILKLISMGETAAWPKIETVRIQTTISRTLDSIQKNFDQNLLATANTAKKSVNNR